MSWSVVQSDAVEFLRAQPADSLDLVFGSPPYEQARLYLENGQNLGISRKTGEWVQWMGDVFQAAQAACKGLVAFVVAGQTRNYRWSAGPALLIAELHKRGMNLRNPPIFSRVGIPGSGGPDWLRSDYEWIVCTSRPGKLAWSDNTALGHLPKWAPGGEMSHRVSNGARVNQWGHSADSGATVVAANGVVRSNGKRPSHKTGTRRDKRIKDRAPDSERDDIQNYEPPDLANPGNVINVIVGGGVMGGDQFTSQNEAPFPEKLAEFFVKSFCPPDGIVCDPFSGSGTTMAVCKSHGRNFTGCDLRQSQVDLALKRLATVTPPIPGMF